MIPYGRQFIDEDDINAVVEVLRSDWLTTGPKVNEFEETFADFVGAKYAVAVNSGTAALHATMFALGIKPGDEVIVPSMTFAATANCVVFQGGTPLFLDVEVDTLLIDPGKIKEKITERTKAIIAVDFAGQPCDYERLWDIAARHGLKLVADGCHALGAEYKRKLVGSLAEMTVFSFHPVKHITTGEGGMVTTDDPELAHRMRIFRNHGLSTDHHQRAAKGSWYYEMVDLGFNYRLTDIQCALGIRQLQKLPAFITRRREVAKIYYEAFSGLPEIQPLRVRDEVFHAYHLFVVRVDNEETEGGRDVLFRRLRDAGIGVNVHYLPVHLHPFYQNKFQTCSGMCPVAERAYREVLSLPIFPSMKDEEIELVIKSVASASIQGV